MLIRVYYAGFCSESHIRHHHVTCDTLYHTAGVKIVEKVTVDKVLVSNNRVCGVKTNKGDIKCEVFVNCAGQVR